MTIGRCVWLAGAPRAYRSVYREESSCRSFPRSARRHRGLPLVYVVAAPSGSPLAKAMAPIDSRLESRVGRNVGSPVLESSTSRQRPSPLSTTLLARFRKPTVRTRTRLPLSRKTRSGTCRLPFPLLLLLPGHPASFRHNIARQDPATDFSTEAEAGIVRGTSASLLAALRSRKKTSPSSFTAYPLLRSLPQPHHQQLFVGLTCLTARASCSPPALCRFWRLKVGPSSIARTHARCSPWPR